jgi:pSer/pThr/pTyr-binding forkhead associated (FHA) protein
MSNHDSFLKMIGLNESAQPEVKENDFQNQEAQEEHSQETQSETEWEMSAAQPLLPEETAEPASEWDASQDASHFVETESGSPEISEWSAPSVSQAGELNAEFHERITRTEVSQKSQVLDKTEIVTSHDKTALYTKEEAEAVEAEPIRGLTFTGTHQTQETVPYDYNPASSAISRISAARTSAIGAGEGTAHFDYSKQEGGHRIVVLAGNVNAQAFHLNQLPLRFGREPQNEAVLDDANASRFHAEIREGAEGLVVVDLGSTNGVKVNGALVSEHLLRCHDIVQIGDCLFEFLDAGVLSKGEPLKAVVSESKSGVFRPTSRGKKKLFLVAASVVGILILGVALLSQSPSVQDLAKQKAAQVAMNVATQEIEALRSMMETTYQMSIEKIDAQEVKKAFMERFEAKGLFAMAPGSKEKAESLPSPMIHLLVMEPDLYAQIAAEGATQEAFVNVLTTRINALIDAKNFPQALRVAEVLLAISEGDQRIKDAYEKLRLLVDRMQPAGSAPSASVSALEQEFYALMEEHENRATRLIDEAKTEEAIRFSDIVIENISKLGHDDPRYARVTQEETARWAERRDKLKEKLEQKTASQKRARSTQADGEELFERIQDAFDSNQFGEAKKLVEKFNEDFSEHERAEEVLNLSAQMDQMIERSFEATQSSVKTMMETESYETAWKELYRFQELMPPYPPAEKLKTELAKVAGSRAAQFYNQARVFEFEADDLVAAEQYYKKTLEFADPESELFQKAKRRFEDVKRKGIR